MSARKRTVFTICPTHTGFFAGETRRRTAEVFGEGGPGSGKPCGPTSCRIAPGTDLFAAYVCERQYDTTIDGHEFSWRVNL